MWVGHRALAVSALDLGGQFPDSSFLTSAFLPRKSACLRCLNAGVLAESLRWHMQSRAAGSCLEVDSSPGAGPVRPVRLVLVYPLPACPEHRSPRTAFSGIQEGTLPCPQTS